MTFVWQVHLKKIKLKDEIPYIAARMASLSPGMVGADIANICNEAAIVAARYRTLTYNYLFP